MLFTKVKLSTAFHPQMDGQAKHLPLVDFAYSNSYHSTIFMAPYEAFCGRRCRSLIEKFEVGESSLLGPGFIYKTFEKVHIIKNLLQNAYSRQNSYVNHRRRDFEFEEGDKVYLKMFPMKWVVSFGKKGILSPRYVSPY